MATPAQLMDVLADVMGIPLATIVDHDRKLTKAGLRTKGGRGLSVAHVTPLDAARLLTSLLAGSRATDAAPAVDRYAGTGVDKARSSDGCFAAVGLSDLARLPLRHSFVEALAAVIVAAATGSIAAIVAAKSALSIDVFALVSATRGRIRISELPEGRTVNVEYGPTGTRARPPGGGDFEQSRRVTERTILAIAALLKEETSNE